MEDSASVVQRRVLNTGKLLSLSAFFAVTCRLPGEHNEVISGAAPEPQPVDVGASPARQRPLHGAA